ncbi:hypothetical protein ACTMTJ_39160 [Phytohabitans sp. LJ34]|uniref:hypothetical protein n=1 Tax=Phytohabitans sp. LJ34 TaxID=3452217 RepID=UPI003F8BAEDE
MTRRLLLTVAAVAALLLPSTPAAAAETVYYAAPCASGAFTGYAGSLDGKRPLVVLSGWARPCVLTPSGTKFGFVHYYQQTALLPIDDSIGTGLKDYKVLAGRTEFTVTSDLTSTAHTQLESELGQLTAICLIRDRNARLACVAVDRPTPDAAPVVTPLPVDDERVRSIPVTGQLESGDIAPITQHCGNCI